MIRVGTDIIEISRIEGAVGRWQEAFLKRVYTQAELECCEGKCSSLAARFSAKEAVTKSLNGRAGIAYRDIEILNDAGGAPVVTLRNGARSEADAQGVKHVAVSLSHCEKYAVATSIAYD